MLRQSERRLCMCLTLLHLERDHFFHILQWQKSTHGNASTEGSESRARGEC